VNGGPHRRSRKGSCQTLLLLIPPLLLLALGSCGQMGSSAHGDKVRTSAAKAPASSRIEPSLSARNCFSALERCGYPGPHNVGAEASTGRRCSELRSSGSITASTAGQRIEDLDIMGHVYVEAPDVTLNDDCVTDDEGFAHAAVKMEAGARALTVSNSTIRGVGEGYRSIEIALQGSDAAGNVATRDLLYSCAECVHAEWTLTKSYINSNGLAPRKGIIVEGGVAHVEDWYYNGETVIARENTMLNPEDSVAIMFGNTGNGAGGACANHIYFERNFVAGGGFMFYPCGNSSSAGASTMTIRGNRFARCSTTRPDHESPNPGGTKCGYGRLTPINTGADAHGYFPLGGYFGVATSLYTGARQVWEDNFWDDDLHEARP
jgi:hypothetical protein